MDWTITAHVDRQTKTVDGVTFKNTHSGQKRAYGDSYYEYEVTSDRDAEHVKRICCEHAYKCDLPIRKWREEGQSASNYFRNHYEFEDRGNGKFFYRVTFPYAD